MDKHKLRTVPCLQLSSFDFAYNLAGDRYQPEFVAETRTDSVMCWPDSMRHLRSKGRCGDQACDRPNRPVSTFQSEVEVGTKLWPIHHTASRVPELIFTAVDCGRSCERYCVEIRATTWCASTWISVLGSVGSIWLRALHHFEPRDWLKSGSQPPRTKEISQTSNATCTSLHETIECATI